MVETSENFTVSIFERITLMPCFYYVFFDINSYHYSPIFYLNHLEFNTNRSTVNTYQFS